MEKTKSSPPMRIMDMTQGNIIKLILTFAIPLFIGNVFQQVYSLADTAVAGHCLGDSAIAAIGATSSLYAILIDFASGLNSGCAIVVTNLFGAHDEQKLKKAIAGMIELDVVITLAVTALALIFLRPLMVFMNIPESIFEQAHQYIFIICAGMITTIAYNLFSSILRAFGNSRTSLYFLIISSVLNICMDLLFVAGLGMDVSGAALATVIAEGISAVLCGIYVFRHYKKFLPQKSDYKVPVELISELFSNGIAMALMYCIVDLGSIIFQRANNSLGESIISAHTASRRIMGIMMQPLSTISIASSTFVGQNWGAKKPDRIRSALRQVMLMEILWSVFSCAVIFAAGGEIIKLTIGTSNTEVVDNAVLSLRCHLSFFPVLGCLLALRTAMQSMGKKTAPIISSIMELGMKLLSAAFLIPQLGFLGTCITEPITWTLMLLFLTVVYFIIRKQLYGSLETSAKKNP